MLTRRNLLQLGAAAVSARKLPVMVAPAVPKPRCDADYIEGEWAAGRAVRNGRFVVRRPLRMTVDGSVLERCFVVVATGLLFHVSAEDCMIRHCAFVNEQPDATLLAARLTESSTSGMRT